jgi:RimJ/RimL family protein N-acetyltransferase
MSKLVVGPLETERFILKPMGMIETLRVTNNWRHDRDILNGLMQTSKPRSLGHWLLRGPLPRTRHRFAFAIVPKGEQAAIGAHMVRLQGYRSAFGTVAVHDRNWWGKNVVVEVRARLMNHFFAHCGVERFYGVVDSRNVSSIFSYRRLGFDHVGTWHRQKQNPVTGDVIDFVNFEMFRDQWMRGPFWEAPDGRQ